MNITIQEITLILEQFFKTICLVRKPKLDFRTKNPNPLALAEESRVHKNDWGHFNLFSTLNIIASVQIYYNDVEVPY